MWICDSCSLSGVSLGPNTTLTASYYSELKNLSIADGGSVLMGSSRCIASNVTIEPGGYLSLASGASALAVTSAAGAVVEADEGAYIEYSTTEESNE